MHIDIHAGTLSVGVCAAPQARRWVHACDANRISSVCVWVASFPYLVLWLCRCLPCFFYALACSKVFYMRHHWLPAVDWHGLHFTNAVAPTDGPALLVTSSQAMAHPGVRWELDYMGPFLLRRWFWCHPKPPSNQREQPNKPRGQQEPPSPSLSLPSNEQQAKTHI